MKSSLVFFRFKEHFEKTYKHRALSEFCCYYVGVENFFSKLAKHDLVKKVGEKNKKHLFDACGI